jgi:hypothetical protein
MIANAPPTMRTRVVRSSEAIFSNPSKSPFINRSCRPCGGSENFSVGSSAEAGAKAQNNANDADAAQRDKFIIPPR